MATVAEVVIADRANIARSPLSEIPFIGSLPGPCRDRLLQSAGVARFSPGSQLFGTGALPTDLYILLSGMVDFECTYGSHDCMVMIMSPGDVLNPAAVLFNEPYLTSANVLIPSRILLVGAQAVRAEARKTPELVLSLAKIIAGHWRLALRMNLDLKCRSPAQRLGSFLLRLHEARSPKTLPQLPFSKRQLASRIGMQPETLSRALQTLAANGLHLRGRIIDVTDRERMESFCGPDPYPRECDPMLGVHAL